MHTLIKKCFQSCVSWRYERKFRAEGFGRSLTEQNIKSNPLLFREIYHLRAVHNIYLDTHDFFAFQSHMFERSQRLKVRIRWYDDPHFQENTANLELKIKNGYQVGKLCFPLRFAKKEDLFFDAQLQEIFKNSQLPEWLKIELKKFRASLVNQYQRRYFLSHHNIFRFTIDDKMEYSSIRPFKQAQPLAFEDDRGTLIELKYPLDHPENDLALVSQNLPFRLTKSSKYITGMSLISYQSAAS